MDREKIHGAVHLMLHLDRMHRAAIERQVGEMGLHRSQHRMLMVLARSEEMPSQAELARRMDISPPAVANTLARLEKEGYIRRAEDSRDSRNHKVYLTDKGRNILESTKVRFDSVDRAMFAQVSEQELEQFTGLLARMQQNLKTFEQEATK